MANAWWNPLRSYEIDKYTKPGIKPGTYDKDEYERKHLTTSFWVKLKGTFFMFSGYLGEPDHELIFGNVSGTNHLGVFDYLTLGIPYAIEAFFRGNWLAHEFQQLMCQAIFSTIPIVPVLATVRNGIGLIATILSIPFVFGIYLGDLALSDWKKSKQEKRKAEYDEVSQDRDLLNFHTSYKNLSGIFKQYKSGESNDQNTDAHEYLGQTQIYAKKIRESNKSQSAFFSRKIHKIEQGGKYSAEKIDCKFQRGTL